MVVSGKIHYGHHQIAFEAKINHQDIKEGEIASGDAKHELIHAINRKCRVKYPLSSTVDPVHVKKCRESLW